MNNGKVNWFGNFPAVVSPFTKDGAIDDGKFVANLELLVSEGARGVVVSGSNGESWALSPDERLRLFKLAKNAVGKRVTVIGGTGMIPTQSVVDLTIAARKAGVDGVMIMPPYYCGLSRRDVLAHFKMISDEAKTPILIYNSPKAVGFDVTAEVADDLSNIEWVVGIKQSTLDFTVFEQTVAACGDKLRVFTGHSAKRGLAAVMAGAVGFVSSLDSHVFGREGISLYDLAVNGEYEKAKAIQMRTLQFDRAVAGVASGPAIMKAAMNLLGRPGGYPRRPLLEASREELEKIEAAMHGVGLFSKKSSIAA